MVRNLFRKRVVAGVAAALAVVLVLGGGFWAWTRVGTTSVTAYFGTAVGIYRGSDVRILGVKVGTVTAVEPEGDQVRVELRVDRGIDIPADARAMQVTPSVVADRYVQLAPAYTGGPTLASGTVLGRDRTATPVEVDELYASVDKLTAALGPDGANAEGALTDLLHTGAATLDGNGETLGRAIDELSRASSALSESRGDLFSTIDNLNRFVGALADSDAQVRRFNTQLATVSGQLAADRDTLGTALRELAPALGEVADFVRSNHEQLAQTVTDLLPTTQAVADKRESLINALTMLPLAVSNLTNSYDAEAGALASRILLPDLADPGQVLCRLFDVNTLLPGNEAVRQIGDTLRPIIEACKLASGTAADAIKGTNVVLPFGILSSDALQRRVIPNADPGVLSSRMPSPPWEERDEK